MKDRIVNVIINFMAKGLTELTASLKGLNKEVNQLNAGVNRTRKGMAGMRQESSRTTKEANKSSAAMAKQRRELQKTEYAAKKSRGAFANFGKQLVNTAAFLLRFALVIGIFQAINLAIVGTAKAAAQFQEALFDLQAIANVTNKEMERLRDVTLDVAGSTRFTATEIVALEKSLARLGFSTSQIIESTEPIARFAEATGESAEEVAEFVGKQLKAFQLATIQTTELVNAYTTAINNSALNLESLATSSQYASSISRSLGITFKEQNALLATLADNGLTASRAGTGLRKILIELGAEGGSLIPILSELAEQGLSLAEAEELVGDRAAGALIALVSQADSVSNLIEMQESMSAVLIASARQNASFTGQVDAMRAAVNKLAIELGNWITKTEAVLYIIERLGGGTKPRGFTFLQSLGLTGEETDKLIENADALTILAQTYRDNIEELRSGGRQNVALASKNLLEAAGISTEGMTMEELAGMYKDIDALISLIQDYSDQQDRRTSILTDAERMSSNFQASIKGEANSYMLISKEIKSASDRIKEYRNKARDLTEAEENQIAILEAYIELLRQSNIVEEEKQDLDEKSIDSFESLNSLYEQLAKAINDGDYAKEQYIKSQIMEKEELLESLGLYDKYLYYLDQTVKKEDELVRKRLEKERVERAGGEAVASGGRLLTALGFSLQSGNGDPRAAAELAFDYLDKVGQEFGYDSKYYKELQKEVFQFTDLIFENEDADGLSSSDKEDLKRRIAQFASFVNNQILDATSRRLEAEQAAVDARYNYEEDRLNSLLQANIIGQEQYERQRLRLEKERVAKTNEIERKRFNAEKANSLAEIAIQTAINATATGLNPVVQALIIAFGAAQSAIVASQKFRPVKFAKGGKIEGASHAQGGVPFSVNGRAGFEAEGGEFIVNKKATEAFLPTLERINEFGQGSIPAARSKFANGGVVPEVGRTDELLEELVRQSGGRTMAYIVEEQLVNRNNTRIQNDIRRKI